MPRDWLFDWQHNTVAPADLLPPENRRQNRHYQKKINQKTFEVKMPEDFCMKTTCYNPKKMKDSLSIVFENLTRKDLVELRMKLYNNYRKMM